MDFLVVTEDCFVIFLMNNFTVLEMDVRRVCGRDLRVRQGFFSNGFERFHLLVEDGDNMGLVEFRTFLFFEKLESISAMAYYLGYLKELLECVGASAGQIQKETKSM